MKYYTKTRECNINNFVVNEGQWFQEQIKAKREDTNPIDISK